MTRAVSYPVRTEKVTWRDVAGEVVVVHDDGTTVRLMNKTASVIWTMADGSVPLEEISRVLHSRFDISLEEAIVDTNEFCDRLEKAGLLSLRDAPATEFVVTARD